MDDVGRLHRLVPDEATAEIVLQQQVKHVNRVLPYFLVGMLLTAFIFYVMMEAALHKNFLVNPIHFIWIVYHSTTVMICWYLWRKVLAPSTQITHKFAKQVFINLFIFFLLAIIFGLAFFFLNIFYSITSIESWLFLIWFIYHNFALYFCYSSWKKVDRVIYATEKKQELSVDADTIKIDEVILDSESKLQIDYLTSYTAYRVLFTCMLLIGCLWAIAVAKVLTTDIELYIQIVVLIGLNFTIISGAMSSFGIFQLIFNAFAMPSLLTWALLLLYLQDAQLIILSLVVMIFVFTHSYFARHNWLTSIKTIQVFLENTHLVSQLETKSKQLERISSAKTKFLAFASHDLRQPAHALNLFIETLSRTNLDKNQRNIVEYAKTASQSSSDMLNSILDYSHLESGEMIPNIAATKLDPLIQSLVDEFSAEAELKGIELRYRKTNICVISDPAMLSLILRNFLSNAIRYTVKGGVLIGVRYIDEVVNETTSFRPNCRVSVWDTGIGIKQQDIEGVFDSFHQLETHTQTKQGLGLGLSIAKGLSNLLSSSINVRSEFGRGSQFYIDLPVCDSEECTENLTESTIIEKTDKTVVLVVDDEETVLVSMKFLLQSWGYKVITALNKDEAVRKYKLHIPKILITDYQLGGSETGEEVVKSLQTISTLTDKQSQLQVLLLTGDTSPKIIQIAKSMGISLLHKPIAPNVLRNKLKEMIAKT